MQSLRNEKVVIGKMHATPMKYEKVVLGRCMVLRKSNMRKQSLERWHGATQIEYEKVVTEKMT